MTRTAIGLLFLSLVLLTACSSGPGAIPATPLPAATATPAAAATNPTGPALAPGNAAPGAQDLVVLNLVPADSQASYRVREQLASVSFPTDAVGTTKNVTGTVTGKTDGTIVSSQSKFVVDLRTLQSDRSQRDNFLRRNTLETDTYPYATFVPTQAIGLPSAPPASGQVSFQLVGDLTIRNVTKSVTWNVQAKIQGNDASGQAQTTFNFEYFNLTPPRVAAVLSVVDNIQLEMVFHLQRVTD